MIEFEHIFIDRVHSKKQFPLSPDTVYQYPIKPNIPFQVDSLLLILSASQHILPTG